MDTQSLQAVAQALVAPGKGILAIDESLPTIKKRFDTVGVTSTEENRRAYREVLIAAEGAGEYVSGMILFDETLRQAHADGTGFVQVLERQGIVAGIKVDKGAKPLAGHDGELVTEGLDGLRERLGEYHALGARFAKWRAVITIGDGLPSDACLTANAHALARYAALCQEAALVPVVEPEVLMDGAHDVETCYRVTERALRCLFAELYTQRVALEGLVLKTGMVLSGSTCPRQADVAEVARVTMRCLRHSVPAAVAGIVFLSGGQEAVLATRHLQAMNAAAAGLPWPLSFSYGRALQEPCLKTWQGRTENVAAARRALLHRERCNSLASLGRYSDAAEQQPA